MGRSTRKLKVFAHLSSRNTMVLEVVARVMKTKKKLTMSCKHRRKATSCIAFLKCSVGAHTLMQVPLGLALALLSHTRLLSPTWAQATIGRNLSSLADLYRP